MKWFLINVTRSVDTLSHIITKLCFSLFLSRHNKILFISLVPGEVNGIIVWKRSFCTTLYITPMRAQK